MKGTAVGILLLALAGTCSLAAQDRNWRSHHDNQWQRVDHGRHNDSRDCRDRRTGYRDIRRDERELAYDRRELRQYLRDRNYRAARREREEMRERERDLYRDRREARNRRDRNWDWVRNAGWGWR